MIPIVSKTFVAETIRGLMENSRHNPPKEHAKRGTQCPVCVALMNAEYLIKEQHEKLQMADEILQLIIVLNQPGVEFRAERMKHTLDMARDWVNKPNGYKVECNSGIRQTVTPTEGGFQA